VDPLAQKNLIYEELADRTISGLEKGEISPEESDAIADLVLQRLENVSTEEGMTIFLEELSKSWDIFGDFFLKWKSEISERQDKEKIGKIHSDLNSLINNN
jgi:hypothetical protein